MKTILLALVLTSACAAARPIGGSSAASGAEIPLEDMAQWTREARIADADRALVQLERARDQVMIAGITCHRAVLSTIWNKAVAARAQVYAVSDAREAARELGALRSFAEQGRALASQPCGETR